MNTPKQLLASDYDKTLYRKERAGDLAIQLKAVKRWRAQGHAFVISTGRDAASMEYERHHRGVEYDYLVSLNGSFIVDSDGEVLFKQALDNALAREIAALLRVHFPEELIVSNGFDGCNFTNKTNSLTDKVAKEIFERNSQIYSKTVEQALEGEVLLLGCLCNDLEQARAIREEILAQYADQVEVFINLHYINVVPKGISKASGIELVTRLSGVEHDAICAIGDDYNDIPMLERYAGYAVENAKPEVKDVAQKVYPGVAELIDEKLA